jgi:hypothetical protein
MSAASGPEQGVRRPQSVGIETMPPHAMHRRQGRTMLELAMFLEHIHG